MPWKGPVPAGPPARVAVSGSLSASLSLASTPAAGTVNVFAWLTIYESLTALGVFGDRVGTLLCLECGLDPGNKVSEYLNTYDTGSLAVNFDPANFLVNGFDPLASLTALAGKVAHTHSRDVRTTTVSGGRKEVSVGAGDIEWLIYVATLESIDYRGYLVVERQEGENRFADAAAGVKFLKRFVSSP